MPKIQVKTYYKKYLSKRKGNYRCLVYYLYLPKRVAEPFIGKELTITSNNSSILIKPTAN